MAPLPSPPASPLPPLPLCLQTGRPTCHALPSPRRRFPQRRRPDHDADDAAVEVSGAVNGVNPAGNGVPVLLSSSTGARLDAGLRHRENDGAESSENDAGASDATPLRLFKRRRRETEPANRITLADVRWKWTGRPRPQPQLRPRFTTRSPLPPSSSCRIYSSRSSSSSSSSSSSPFSSFLCHKSVLLFALFLLSFVHFAASNWQKNLPANLVVQPEGESCN